jgi:signal transduction histidine kinase
MERLVDDLLLLAKADSGVEVNGEPAELEPMLVAEVEGFRETSDRRFEIGRISERRVEIDRDRMARAVSNLISNAVAHTGEGGTVRVSALDQGAMVVVAVEDDGPGVPAAMRDRVFDRFARLDSSRSSDSGGSGLGLAIVKAIAESQGGTVGCSDSPLGGARFTVSLPAV